MIIKSCGQVSQPFAGITYFYVWNSHISKVARAHHGHGTLFNGRWNELMSIQATAG